MTQTYAEPVSQLLKLGRPEGVEWLNYSTLDITRDHIPELIQLVEDHTLRFIEPPDDHPQDEELPEWYAQIHAWRALAQLAAEQAIPAVLGILHQVDDDDDDWIGEDARMVFALIGPATIRPVAEYLANGAHGLWARVAAATSLQHMGVTYPEARAECVRWLASVLEKYQENEEELNGSLIDDLTQLKAIEHIDLIRQAFAAERVDEFVGGDFEDVQIELGLIEKRTHPRRSFFESLPGKSEVAQPKIKSHHANKKEKAKRKQAKKSRKKNRNRK